MISSDLFLNAPWVLPAIGAALLLVLVALLSDRRPRRTSKSYKKPDPTPLTDAAEQLRLVMVSNFTARPLLNPGELRLFQEVQRFVSDANPQWLVMAQVSLGEIIRGEDAKAHACINSKRVDLLLVDQGLKPRHAIEYQGSGHYQGNAAARDAVKKEALRRAGIGYHEVLAGQTKPSELQRLIHRLVEPPGAGRTS